MKQPLILASASPQRKRLLSGIGVHFDVVPSQLDEKECSEQNPLKRAQLLSYLKAKDVVDRNPNAWVIGGDSLVVAEDGTLLEKPENADEARVMLRRHSGSTSVVHSGLCLISPDGNVHEGMNSSKVTFRTLSDADIEWWIETGHWQDRSGAFQIDGVGQMMIESIEGDWTGIVGLPVFLLGQLAREAGLELV